MKFGKVGVLGLCLLGAIALILALLAPSLFFGNGKAPLNQAGPASVQAWPLAAKGVVESELDVEIASRVEGLVAEMLVDEGDRVTTGQPLVRLVKGRIEAQVAAAAAGLRQASARRKELETGYRREDVAAAQHALDRAVATSSEAHRNFERQQRLFGQGATTRVALDRAEEGWQVAAANLQEARDNLSKMKQGPRSEELAAARAAEERMRAEAQHFQELLSDFEMTSPIGGVIINRLRDVGETVDVGTPILTIINPEKLRIRAEIEETDVGKVTVGQSVSVTVDAHAGKEFKGKVTKTNAAVQRKAQKSFDPAATFDINTQKVLIALDDYNGLVHGMSVTVRFLK